MRHWPPPSAEEQAASDYIRARCDGVLERVGGDRWLYTRPRRGEMIYTFFSGRALIWAAERVRADVEARRFAHFWASWEPRDPPL